MPHFRTVAGATDLPIMIYNNPVAYNVDITPEMFARTGRRTATSSPSRNRRTTSAASPTSSTSWATAISSSQAWTTWCSKACCSARRAGSPASSTPFPHENRALVGSGDGRAVGGGARVVPLVHAAAASRHPQSSWCSTSSWRWRSSGFGTEMVRARRGCRSTGAEREEILEIIRTAIATRPESALAAARCSTPHPRHRFPHRRRADPRHRRRRAGPRARADGRTAAHASAPSSTAFRSAVVNEPRGTDAIVGALLCEPLDPSCDAGVIFFNNVGYLNMCGHGTIGLVVTLAHLGRIEPGRMPDRTRRRRGRTRGSTMRTARHRPQRAELPQRSERAGRRRRASAPCTATSPGAATGSSSSHDHGQELDARRSLEQLTDFTWRVRQALEAARHYRR